MTSPLELADPAVHVYSLNVGHGACTIVFVRNEGTTEAVLIDCGMIRGEANQPRKLEELFIRVRRELEERSVFRLQAIVVSHSDDDHTRGLMGFVDDFTRRGGSIAFLYANRDRPGLSPMYQQFFEEISQKGARKVRKIKGAWNRRIIERGPCTIRIMAPEEEGPIVHGDQTNSNHLSAIVRVANGQTSLLVCGDAPATAITELAHRVKDTNVLIAAHHGGKISDASEAEAEIEAAYGLLNPELVIFSAGQKTKLCGSQLGAIAKKTHAALMCTGPTKACDISDSKCAGDIVVTLLGDGRFETDPNLTAQQEKVRLYNPRACKDINRDNAGSA